MISARAPARRELPVLVIALLLTGGGVLRAQERVALQLVEFLGRSRREGRALGSALLDQFV